MLAYDPPSSAKCVVVRAPTHTVSLAASGGVEAGMAANLNDTPTVWLLGIASAGVVMALSVAAGVWWRSSRRRQAYTYAAVQAEDAEVATDAVCGEVG